MTQPKDMIRSPERYLSTPIRPGEPMSRSPGSALSAHSIASATSSTSHLSQGSIPNSTHTRRSTDTTGLDYYWSSVAGAGPGSSTSSLVISPSPSFSGMPPSPVPLVPTPAQLAQLAPDQRDGRPGMGHRSKSNLDLRDSHSPSHSRKGSISNPASPGAPSSHHLPLGAHPTSAGTVSGITGRGGKGDGEHGQYGLPFIQASGLSLRSEPFEQSEDSPGARSDVSVYSNPDSAGVAGPSFPRHPGPPKRADTIDAYYAAYASPSARYEDADEYDFGQVPPTQGPTGVDGTRGRGGHETRESVSTLRGPQHSQSYPPVSQTDEEGRSANKGGSAHNTPKAPPYPEDGEMKTPQLGYDVAQFVRHPSPSHSQSSNTSMAQTPTRMTNARGSPSSYTPGSGRQKFYPSPSSANISGGSGSGSPAITTPNRSPHTAPVAAVAPQSAPAHKTGFGVDPMDQREEAVVEDTIGRGKNNRNTMPPQPMSASSSIKAVDGLLSPEKGFLTPDRPTAPSSRGSSSPVRTPELPPRSSLRNHFVHSASGDHLALKVNSTPPLNVSPRGGEPLTLPTIINTSHSPDGSPTKQPPPPSRPSRSPSRASSDNGSTSISELTDMLGGAIDEIQRKDSKDSQVFDQRSISSSGHIPTPGAASLLRAPMESPQELDDSRSPLAAGLNPDNQEQRESSPNLTPIAATIPAQSPSSTTTAPRSNVPPSSFPPRGASLDEEANSTTDAADSMPPPPKPSANAVAHGPPLQQLRRPNSTTSLKHQAQLSMSPTSTIGPQPWPSAMAYGNIKGIKYPGDRAKAYARAINELAKADSGLRDWCLASASHQSRSPPAPAAPYHSKSLSRASLGLRTTSYSSQHSLAPPSMSAYAHGRTPSAGSEFPRRPDAYAAREISQRMMDPSDQPSALPPNLPYPQLQQLNMSTSVSSGLGGFTGMKASPSMQSVVSTASKKGGFFSNIGKKSSKKDSTSLGPPTSTSKKDVRGLPISSPSSFRSASPQKPDDPTGGMGPGRLVGSTAPPSGPRGPRGSFTPPPPIRDSMDTMGRNSLDTGMGRPRGSLDSHFTHPQHPAHPGTYQSQKGSMPPSLPARGSPMAPSVQWGGGGSNGGSPAKEDDVKRMSEVLPHADRGILRSYLARYGDQMQAIGAYIEDEKRGQIPNVRP